MPIEYVAFEPGAYLAALSASLLTGRRRFLLRGLTPAALAFATLAQPLKASFPFTLDGADRAREDAWPRDLVTSVAARRLSPGDPDSRYDAIFVFVVDSLDEVLRDYDPVADTVHIVAPAVPYSGPAVPVVALPKSGGTWLTATLGSRLGTCVSYASRNTFPVRTIDAVTLEHAARAGHVLHEHADASPLNLQALRVLAPKVVLHVRDPRGALLSLGHYLRYQLEAGTRVPAGLLHLYPAPPLPVAQGPVDAFVDWALSETLAVWVTWIAQWLEIADAGGSPRVLVTDHGELALQPDRLIHRVTDFFEIPRARLQRIDVPKTMQANFRAGDPQEWQAVFTPEQRARAARLVPAEMKRRFGWADA